MRARPRILLFGVLGLMVLVTIAACRLAVSCWDTPLPGLLTDPFGTITNYGWPGWSGYQQGLSFPTQVERINGQLLPPHHPLGPYPADVLAEAAQGTADRVLHLVVRDPGGSPRTVLVRAERLVGVPWLLLYGGYTLLGWIWLLAAGFSYLVRPDSGGVRAFSRWALLNALLLLTAFDYHTTRRLAPLFALAYALLPAAVLELGLRFPDDIAPLRKWPGLVWAARAVGALLFGWIGGAWLRGESPATQTGLCIGLSILFLAGQMVARWFFAQGRRRTQLLLGLCLWTPVYLMVGLMLVFAPERGGVYIMVGAVPLTALGTLGITYALVRYDLWDSRVLVRRRILRPLVTAVLALTVGLLGAIGVVGLSRVAPSWLQALLGFTAATAFLPLHRVFESWLDGKLFPAEVLYRPTVEQLSLRFTDLASRAAVAEAVESTVRQWLPCDRVRFAPLPPPRPQERLEDSGQVFRSLPPVAAMAAMALSRSDTTISSMINPPSNAGSLSLLSQSSLEPPEWRRLRHAARKAGIDGVTSDQAAALCKGEVVRPPVPVAQTAVATVVFPARFRDQVVGLLAVWAKQPGQMVTSEDETLLRTIANQAALALACANAYEEVEALRKAQQVAFREEKEAALSAFAAEIAHEIRNPINYVRILLDGYNAWVRDGVPPEAEDVEIGHKELERLERMAGSLRRIATSKSLGRTDVGLRQLVDHVRLLLRDRLVGRALEIDVDSLLDVDGDRDAMTQVLVNLISNALDACPAPGRVGVSCEALHDRRLRLTVWDTGPGFAADVGKLFQPLFTTKKTGTGLGLPITRRLVRAHGWEIGALRHGDRTCFEVVIPPEEWRHRPPPMDEGQFESNPLR